MPAVELDRALFGKYEMGRLLGCGAFAKVYHARELRSGQSVAIKIINKNRLSSSKGTKREISVMHRLRHPNIVRLHEVLATKTKIYFVMEYVKGGELFARVAKGRLSEDVARRYFRQLVSAVGYCHSRGVFHRDLKPENLLLDETSNLKVTDFGLSAELPYSNSSLLLHTLCGTPAYVAPEILVKGGYDGACVDVWSCGVVLFVIVAGYLPFNDSNLMKMYRKIYNGEYRCPKWMSGELKHLLSRLLDTNPATRITLDGILKDPWFDHGSPPEINFYHEEETSNLPKLEDAKPTLNAFHLISFSSGLDLSGLFDSNRDPDGDFDRVVTPVNPERVVKRVSDLAASQGLRTKTLKEYGLLLSWPKGTLSVELVVHRLTDQLVVVEVKRKDGDWTLYRDSWKSRFRQIIDGGTDVDTVE